MGTLKYIHEKIKRNINGKRYLEKNVKDRKRISEAKWSFDISQNFLKMTLLIKTISKQQRNLKKFFCHDCDGANGEIYAMSHDIK